MTGEEHHGRSATDLLAALHRHAPDSHRMAKTRSQCLAALSHRRPESWIGRALVLSRRRALEPAFLVVAIVAFLSEVVHRALALYGL